MINYIAGPRNYYPERYWVIYIIEIYDPIKEFTCLKIAFNYNSKEIIFHYKGK